MKWGGDAVICTEKTDTGPGVHTLSPSQLQVFKLG